MIKLYYAARTRSARILWLLEELGLPYELVRVDFDRPASRFFAQETPLGKFPTIEDGDLVMCESTAIAEYILERYGEGRLAPPVGSPLRGPFLQWLHFAESTAFPPIGIVVWLSVYREQSDDLAALLSDARERAASSFDFLEREVGDKRYLTGDDFSAADIMMGFTLTAAKLVGVLSDRHPRVSAYLDRLQARPAFAKVMATE